MKTKVHFLMILLSFFGFMTNSLAATYYTSVAGSTLAGNGTLACSGWTSNTDGVTGSTTVTINSSDTIVILNGGSVTISAATTVGALTIDSGGTLIHTTGTFIANGTFTWNGTLETNSSSGNFNANGNVVGTTAIHTSTASTKRGVYFNGTSKTINLIQLAGVPDTGVGFMYMATSHALAGNTTLLSPLGWAGNATLDLAGHNLSVTSIQGGTASRTITGNSASTLQITGGLRASSFYMTSGSETLGSLIIDQTGTGALGSLATTINTNVQVNANLNLLSDNATITPRNLIINGNLTLGSAATMKVEAKGNTPTTDFCQVQVTGNTVINSPATLRVDFLGGYTSAGGTVFNLATSTNTVSGGFTTDIPPTGYSGGGIAYGNGITYTLGTSLGLNKFSKASDVQLYPNPVANVLNVNAPGADAAISVQVVDLTGKTVAATTSEDKSATVSLFDATPGIYIVKVSDGKSSYSQKIIKK